MERGKAYLEIVAHYEDCLARHGDTHLGVDWPNAADAQTRYRVMLEVIPPDTRGCVSLLDFGCGASHLYEYIRQHGLESRIAYSGLDLSPRFVSLARGKFPQVPYYCLDLLAGGQLPEFDYIVMNGVFTEKRSLSYEAMLSYFQLLTAAVFAKTRTGLAFNVMSKLVDRERDDLFHLPLDTLTGFLSAQLSSHFVIRHDYHLYEYTVYVYR
jgi:SAM-dependent methyltransferase